MFGAVLGRQGCWEESGRKWRGGREEELKRKDVVEREREGWEREKRAEGLD